MVAFMITKKLNLSYLVRKEIGIKHVSNVTHNTRKRCIYKQFKVTFGFKYILCFVDISKYSPISLTLPVDLT